MATIRKIRKKIGCYLQTWANYRQGDGKFDFSNIDPNLCTHIVYAFAKLQNNQIESSDPWLDLPSGLNGYGKFNALKQRNPALMTLLSIGGWNEGSQKYSQMASSSSSRSTFVQSVVQYLRKYGFDGLDMDWEYPTMRGGRPEDKRNFVLLLQDLKAALQPQGMLLTAAVGGGKSIVDAAYDVPGISRALDLIHVMTYDYHLSTEGQTGYNAPLYPAAGSTTGDKQLTVVSTISIL
ncbi:probable chitinase 2 [Caerostris darwini]|uniref:Probable chitinase 2 n=1 Tax=Caerostris darwini TaxID=1538125 RepID=A0AAV4RK95_9ARAC|nr:probable chitinase 2 [Caerostris darwini]